MNKSVCALLLLASAGIGAPQFAMAAPVKKAACASVRNRNPYKLESRCVNLQLDGEVRTYRLYKPHSPVKTPMPLLLVLHGGGGTGGAMEALTLGQFNRLADQHRFLVAYPDGIDHSWNDGRSDLKSEASKENVDDVRFLRAVVDQIGMQYPVDAKRVYATGISNGGLISYRLACDAADVFAAIAPVAANFSVELSPECQPSRMPSVAIFNGTDDPIMPWMGGEIKVLWNRRGEVISAQQTFERWAKIGDCAIPTTHMPRNIASDGTSVTRHVARECKDSGEVRLYEIAGGGHTWPGGYPYLGQRIVGKVSHAVNASEVIWAFFAQHRR